MNVINFIAYYVVVFLGICCTVLFFESLYAALNHTERRGLSGIVLLSFLLFSIVMFVHLLDHSFLPFSTACW